MSIRKITGATTSVVVSATTVQAGIVKAHSRQLTGISRLENLSSILIPKATGVITRSIARLFYDPEGQGTRVLRDYLGIPDISRLLINKAAADATNILEQILLVLSQGRSEFDTINLSDQIFVDIVSGQFRIFNDSVQVLESIIIGRILPAFVEQISATDQRTALLISKNFADTTTMLDLAGVFDGITYNYGLSRAETVSTNIESIVISANYKRTLTDSIAQTDADRLFIGKRLTDLQIVNDVKSLAVRKSLADAQSVADVRRLLVNKVNADTLSTGSDAVRFSLLKLLADTTIMLDSASVGDNLIYDGTKLLTDAVSINQRKFLRLNKTAAPDAVIETDATRLRPGLGRFETIIGTDTDRFDIGKRITDATPVLSAIRKLYTTVKSDIISLLDIIELSTIITRSVLDSILITDTERFFLNKFNREIIATADVDRYTLLKRLAPEIATATDRDFLLLSKRLNSSNVTAADDRALLYLIKRLRDSVDVAEDQTTLSDGFVVQNLISKVDFAPATDFFARTVSFIRGERDGYVETVTPISRPFKLLALRAKVGVYVSPATAGYELLPQNLDQVYVGLGPNNERIRLRPNLGKFETVPATDVFRRIFTARRRIEEAVIPGRSEGFRVSGSNQERVRYTMLLDAKTGVAYTRTGFINVGFFARDPIFDANQIWELNLADNPDSRYNTTWYSIIPPDSERSTYTQVLITKSYSPADYDEVYAFDNIALTNLQFRELLDDTNLTDAISVVGVRPLTDFITIGTTPGIRRAGDQLENVSLFFDKAPDSQIQAGNVLGFRTSGNTLENTRFTIRLRAKAGVNYTITGGADDGGATSVTVTAADLERIKAFDDCVQIFTGGRLLSDQQQIEDTNTVFWINKLINDQTTMLDLIGIGDGLNYAWIKQEFDSILIGNGVEGIRRSGDALENTRFTMLKDSKQGNQTSRANGNIFIFSSDLANASGWTTGSVLISSNVTIAPDGTATADKLVEAPTAGNHLLISVVPGYAIAAGSSLTISVYIKSAGNARYLQLTGMGFSGTNETPIFNPDNGVVTTGATTTYVKSAYMYPVGNGWYRCVANVIANGITLPLFGLTTTTTITANANYTGTTGSGIFIWGPQLTTMPVESHYVPTTATSIYTTINTDADTDIISAGTNHTGIRVAYDWLENIDFTLLKTAKAGANYAVSGTTVTSNDTDRLFVGQQYGPRRLSGDPLEQLRFLMLTRETEQQPVADRDVYFMNKVAKQGTDTLLQPGNILTWSENLTVSATSWIVRAGISAVSATAVIAPNGTLTANRITLSGVADPVIGQVFSSNPSGKTITSSIWAWIDAGQPTDFTLFLYDNTVTQVFSTSVVLTTTPTRHRLTATFPVSTSTGFVVRFDPANNPTTGNTLYVWGAQAEYSGIMGNYVPTTTASVVLWNNTANSSDLVRIGAYAPSIRLSGDVLENISFLLQAASAPFDNAVTATSADRLLLGKVLDDDVTMLDSTTFGDNLTYTYLARESDSILIGNGVAGLRRSGDALERTEFDVLKTAQVGTNNLVTTGNLVTFSENFTTSWSRVQILSVTSNAIVGPFGQNNGFKINENGVAAVEHYISQTRTGSNETCTFSAWLKAAERNVAYLQLSNLTTFAVGAFFNLSSGTVLAQGPNADYTGIDAGMQPYPNGWWRCWLTATKGTANNNNTPGIFCVSSTTLSAPTTVYTGTTNSGIYVYGAQLERSPVLGYYVATTTSTIVLGSYSENNTDRLFVGTHIPGNRLSYDHRENLSILTLKRADAGVNYTVSGITVTAADSDRLFIGQQQSGNVRFSGDPLEQLRWLMLTNERDTVTSTETNSYWMNKIAKQGPGTLLADGNLLTFSADFVTSAGWATSLLTVSSNVAVSPINIASVTADRIIENTTTGQHLIFQVVTPMPLTSVAYTVSCWVKYDGVGPKRDFVITSFGEQYVAFDTVSGTVISNTANYPAGVIAYPNGWYRCWTTIRKTNGIGDAYFGFWNNTSGLNNYAGTTGTLLIYGAQVTATPYLTNYVETTSTVIRLFNNTNNDTDRITIGTAVPGIRASGDVLENINFWNNKLIGDATTALDLIGIGDGLNYYWITQESDSIQIGSPTPRRNSGNALENISFINLKTAKTGADYVISGFRDNSSTSITITAADLETIYAFDFIDVFFGVLRSETDSITIGTTPGIRRSGDALENVSFITLKPVSRDTETVTAADQDALYVNKLARLNIVYPAGSVLLNGTSQYLSIAASPNFEFGTGDYTVEWWQYMTSQPANPRVFSIGNFSTARFAVSIEGGGVFYVWANSNIRFSSTLTSYLNRWVHFAISRSSNTTRVFRDGVQLGSYADSVVTGSSSVALSIGQETTPTVNSYFPGNIASFRMVKGNSLYNTSSFSTSTTPLTAVSGTVLLLNTLFGADFLDDGSANDVAVNNNGGATSSALTPFDSSVLYTSNTNTTFPVTVTDADRWLMLKRIKQGNFTLRTDGNLFTFSEDFTTWSQNSAVVTSNVIVAPDGTLTADKFSELTGTAQHFISSTSATPSSGVAYTYSIYVKSAGQSRYLVMSGMGLAVSNESITFNPDAGTVSTPATSSIFKSAGIYPVGNGWYRCWVHLGPLTSVAVPNLGLSNVANNNVIPSYSGTAGIGVYIWGAQFVAWPNVTNYVATTASAITFNVNTAASTDTIRTGTNIGGVRVSGDLLETFRLLLAKPVQETVISADDSALLVGLRETETATITDTDQYLINKDLRERVGAGNQSDITAQYAAGQLLELFYNQPGNPYGTEWYNPVTEVGSIFVKDPFELTRYDLRAPKRDAVSAADTTTVQLFTGGSLAGDYQVLTGAIDLQTDIGSEDLQI